MESIFEEIVFHIRAFAEMNVVSPLCGRPRFNDLTIQRAALRQSCLASAAMEAL